MKDLQQYINESIINEDIKSWIKKFAISSTIALSAISSLNAQPIQVNNFDDVKDKIETVTDTLQQKYDNVITVDGVSHREETARKVAQSKANDEISKSNGKLQILNVKKLYSKTTKTYKYIMTLGEK